MKTMETRFMLVQRTWLILACIVGAMTHAHSLAQTAVPSRPVTLVVPFPPGGGTDTGGRILAEQLGKLWAHTVVVENKGGAAGQIGADQVAKAKPDGYTLLLGNIGTQSINPSLYRKLPYDPDTAFIPITLVAELPLAMMVNPTVPARTAAEFIALAKSQPGKLTYSSAGAGGAPHLAAEMFKDRTGTFILHVPYRGGGPAISDLIAGHVQLSFLTVLEASGHLKAGKLRALAVTGDKRVLAPAGTPRDVVEKIAVDIRTVMADDAVKARFASLGGVPHTSSPQEFAKLITTDRARYEQIIRSRKITVD
jgi:tripartite-type tricarboxylate transporter receptor subunit TctC